MVDTFNPSTWEVKAGASLWGQSGLYSEFQNSQNYVEGLCLDLKKKKKKYMGCICVPLSAVSGGCFIIMCEVFQESHSS